MLVAPKDKPKLGDRSGVVYGIDCNDCDSRYVGETARPLRKRIAEHKREPSPVGAHLKEEGHTFDKDKVKILDSDPRWLQRGIKEAIQIAMLEPDLNQDKGRHHIPPCTTRSSSHVTPVHPECHVTIVPLHFLMKSYGCKTKIQVSQLFVERTV
jgi:hypothetical protein